MDPELQKDLTELTKTLKKQNTSIKNRLLSILKDHQYIATTFKLPGTIPIIPNERCGKWYISPQDYTTTSYFKSTDGHMNNWDISTRRLNLHLLSIIGDEANDGIAIIDSTRRGKRIPDSLSKTVPIWCAVLNSIMLGGDGGELGELLFTPNGVVSSIERDLILKKLPLLIKKMKDVNVISQQFLKDRLNGRLLRPVWVYPGITSIPKLASTKYIPIYLITASEMCQDGENKMNGYTYVQGAADDHELWSNGLDPILFWENIGFFKTIKYKSEDEILQYINTIVSFEKFKNPNFTTTKDHFWKDEVWFTDQIAVARIEKNTTITSFENPYDLIIILEETFQIRPQPSNPEEKPSTSLIKYNLSSKSKKSSKELRLKLPQIITHIQATLTRQQSRSKILICCSSSDDLSIGVLLCCLSLFYDSEWNYCKSNDLNICTTPTTTTISKNTIRRHLVKVIELKENCNPSRATLNSVNSYLMS